MKKQWITMAVVGAAVAVNAGVVTNFFADFQGAADGTISTVADMNAGTAIGSWDIVALEESKFDSNPASNRRLALDQGQYDVTASMAANALLADGVAFSIDFRNLRDGTTKTAEIRLKTAEGFNLLSLRTVPTSNSTGNPDYLQIWDTGSTSWINIAEILQNSPGIPNETGMQTLEVFMDGTGFDVALDGNNLLTDVAYDNTGLTLNTIRFSSPDTNAGVWYDDISVTTIPEPATAGLIALFGGGLILIRRTFML